MTNDENYNPEYFRITVGGIYDMGITMGSCSVCKLTENVP